MTDWLRRYRSILGFALALLLLGGCAQPPAIPYLDGAPRNNWTGRLALRVESDPVQSFFVGFDLRGSAQSGELSLFSPLGSTIARLVWSPGEAHLRWDGKEESFESLDALTRHATGTRLPISSMFHWLNGEQTAADGWQADLGDLSRRRLVARRSAPAPEVEMRLVFE